MEIAIAILTECKKEEDEIYEKIKAFAVTEEHLLYEGGVGDNEKTQTASTF